VGRPIIFTPQPTAGVTISEYRWNFGAGAVPATAVTTTPTPVTVSYTTSGAKTITLTLVAPGGSVDITRANYVNVLAAQPIPVSEGLEAGLPLGWSVVDPSGAYFGTVAYNNPALRIGGFAESPRAIYFNNYDTNAPGVSSSIITAPYNFTGVTTPFFVFDVAHQAFESLGTPSQEVVFVEYSINCGQTWTVAYGKQSRSGVSPNLSLETVTPGSTAAFLPTESNQWRREVVNLSGAAGQPNVVIRIRQVNDFGNNIFLDNFAITTTPPPGRVSTATQLPLVNVAPTAPLGAVATNGNTITLTWADNSTNETGFVVQRAVGAGANPYTTVATLPANTTTYADNSLSNSQTASYRVFALNGTNLSYAAVSSLPVAVQSAAEPFTLLARATTPAGTPVGISGFPQPFNVCGGATYPAGWTNNIIAGSAAFDFWRIDNVASIADFIAVPVSLNPNISGCYAYFSSDRFSAGGGAENVAFESPTINAAGVGTVRLSFNAVIDTRFGGNFFVDVFNPTTSAWEQVYTSGANVSGAAGAVNPNIDISSKVANTTTGRVRFRYTGNWSMAAAIDNVNVFAPVEPGPANLTATFNTNPNRVLLSWLDQTTGETGFDIERSTTSGTAGYTVVATSGALAGTGLGGNFSDNTVAAGVRYWYRVRARLSPTATTEPSNFASVVTILTPTNLTVTGTTTSTASLTWVNNVANTLTDVVIERSLLSGTGYGQVDLVPSLANVNTNFGLTDNTRYWFRVAARQGTTLSDYSNEATAVTPVMAPTNFAARAIAFDRINLTWTDNSNNENGYRLERATALAGPYTLVANLPANTTSFESTGLTADTQYFFRLSPIGVVAGSFVFVAPVSEVTYPAAPTNLVATSTNSTEIRLTWNDNSSTELGTEIYRGGVFLDRIASANATSYIDRSVVLGQVYNYSVRAYRNAAAGEYSLFSNTVVATAVFPAPVLSLAGVGSDRVSLEWTDLADEDGYIIERTTLTDNNIPVGFTTVTTVASNRTAYTDTPLLTGTTYHYRVRAFKNSGISSLPSNVVSATTSVGFPNAPLNLRGTPGNGSAELTWDAVAGVGIRYEVYFYSSRTTNKLAATVNTNRATITGLMNGDIHVFRVRAINNANNASQYSNELELRPSIALGNEDDLAASAIKVYPNPTDKDLTIEIEKSLKATSISIVSVTGQTVYSEKVNAYTPNNISLAGVSSGVYIVRVETETGSYLRKIQVIK
jgi:fibronectin type 3 domain-containing protein